MKRMICDICGSQKFKKENDVFVCQECGTEYALEDAKKSLKEITKAKEEDGVVIEKNDYLKEKLLLWARLLNNIEACSFFISTSEINSDEFWEEKTCLEKVTCNFSSKLQYPLILDKPYYAKDGIRISFSHILTCKDIGDDIKLYNKMADELPNDPTIFMEEVRTKLINQHRQEAAILEKISNDPNYCLSRNYYISYLEKLFNSRFGFEEANKVRNYVNQYEEISVCSYRFYRDIDYFNPSENFDWYQYSEFLLTFYEEYIKPWSRRITARKKGIFFEKDVVIDDGQWISTFCKQAAMKINEFNDNFSNYYKEKILPPLEQCKRVVLESVKNAKKLEKEFNLPVEYRKLSSVLSMIKILDSGKASSWNELVNLYDTTAYRQNVLLSLDTLNTKFDKMINSLDDINSKLNDLGSVMVSINNNIVATSKILEDIQHSAHALQKYSFITMWNSL